LEWRKTGSSPFGFKAGRQQINYRDNRVFGPGQWGNVGRYTWDAFVPQAFWVRYSYGSGDEDPSDNKSQTFDGIFGAIDKYFGRINILCWKNLKDYQLTYQLKLIKGLKIAIDHHWFYLSQRGDYWYYANERPLRDVSGTGSDDLGREWDGFAVYDMNKHLQLQLGICRFLPGTALVKSGFHEKADYIIFQTFIKF